MIDLSLKLHSIKKDERGSLVYGIILQNIISLFNSLMRNLGLIAILFLIRSARIPCLPVGKSPIKACPVFFREEVR